MGGLRRGLAMSRIRLKRGLNASGVAAMTYVVGTMSKPHSYVVRENYLRLVLHTFLDSLLLSI